MFRSAAIVLSLPYFHDEAAAFAFLERIVGPHGTVCPKCGVIGQSNEFAPQHGKANKKHPERKIRFGLWECYACRTQFHCESSHAPLRLQLQAERLLCSSKKGISSQLVRVLGIQLNTAWFMSHRLRKAMHDGKLPPHGGEGVTDAQRRSL